MGTINNHTTSLLVTIIHNHNFIHKVTITTTTITQTNQEIITSLTLLWAILRVKEMLAITITIIQIEDLG